jgi:hypothetical protein
MSNIKLRYILGLLMAIMVLSLAPACKTKSGCESNERVQPKVNRKGELISKRRGSSTTELFDKKRRKRMKH